MAAQCVQVEEKAGGPWFYCLAEGFHLGRGAGNSDVKARFQWLDFS